MSKCIIYDENSRARFSHYKIGSEKKSGNHNRGKLDVTSVDTGKYKFQPKTTGG